MRGVFDSSRCHRGGINERNNVNGCRGYRRQREPEVTLRNRTRLPLPNQNLRVELALPECADMKDVQMCLEKPMCVAGRTR